MDATIINKTVRTFLGNAVNDLVSLTCPEFDYRVNEWYTYVMYNNSEVLGVIYVNMSGKIVLVHSTSLEDIIHQLPYKEGEMKKTYRVYLKYYGSNRKEPVSTMQGLSKGTASRVVDQLINGGIRIYPNCPFYYGYEEENETL